MRSLTKSVSTTSICASARPRALESGDVNSLLKCRYLLAFLRERNSGQVSLIEHHGRPEVEAMIHARRIAISYSNGTSSEADLAPGDELLRVDGEPHDDRPFDTLIYRRVLPEDRELYLCTSAPNVPATMLHRCVNFALATLERNVHAAARIDRLLSWEMVGQNLEEAIFMLGGGGELLSTNRAGREIIASRRFLALVEGRLCRIETDDAAGATTLKPTTHFSERIVCGDEELRLEVHGPTGPETRHMLVARRGKRKITPYERFRKEFGLTEVETAVACGLLDGQDLQTMAARLRISRHTARKYLQSIFMKLGVNRQSDVIRVGHGLLSSSEGMAKQAS